MVEEIIHVTVSNPSGTVDEDTIKSIRDTLRDSSIDGHEYVVSTSDVSLFELPRLDEYVDELASRVAEKLEDTNE